MSFKSGFIAILGRPNVGKSSIMNYLVGEKVAIVSDHPQTTRTKLLGVATDKEWQMVFVDTPGLHTPKTMLGQYMMKTVEDAKEGVDAVVCVIDATFIGDTDMDIIKNLTGMNCPKILAVNKMDIANKEKLMPQMVRLNDCGFDQIVPISAKSGDNMETLKKLLIGILPEGPKYFPDDMMTDQPERVICAEIIREKALNNLRDEVPHGIGVDMLSFVHHESGMYEIHADIYCERAAHKPIIIGKQGAMISKIGYEARRDIEKLLNAKVALKLWVKIREGWRDRASDLKTLGYLDN